MLQKQSVPINFAQGINTKVDPKQAPSTQFLSLKNSIFTKAGLLQKRNGFKRLSLLPETNSTYLTTFGGNLTSIGDTLEAYNSGSSAWVNKGSFQPLSFRQIPVARSSFNQTQCDSVISPSGLVCTVYTEINNSTPAYKYVIRDFSTGQSIIDPTVIPVSTGTVTGSPRVFLLGGYFVILFTNVISATSHLQYISISVGNPTMVSANTDVAAAYVSATSLAWDAVTLGNKLFIAYNTTSGGQSIKVTYLNTSFSVVTPQVFASSIATVVSVCADESNPASPKVYVAYYDSAGATGNVVAVDQNLHTVMTPTAIIATDVVPALTCSAQNGVVEVLYEVAHNYTFDTIPSDYLMKRSVTLPATVTTGTVGTATSVARSVGLASKSFIFNGKIYVLAAYSSPLQPTYFLIDDSGNVISRFAYSNGGGYLVTGLPSAQVIGSTVYIPYLYKDFIESQNTQGLIPSIGTSVISNIYSQTGVNLAKITFGVSELTSSEIGNNLNVSGGQLWSYDGQTLGEQGFSLFPDSLKCTWSATGGSIHAQPDGATNTDAYYYRATYEWTDSQGNIFRSAPSVPVAVTTTSTGTAGSIVINIPTLRLTYKPGIKVVIYRWSIAQQSYFRVTSLTAPLLNSKTVDEVSFTDTLADASILGNGLLYTTGGVIENIAGPAAIATALFDDRLWLINAEDPNLLWYSKQVIESTPVEMSDLFTVYVAPTTGASGSTGELACLYPLDDKLILFKKDAIYYINGSGPDNTGANSQYSQPTFITSSVGCTNQNSIVLTGAGLMFQSDKGIWLLGRNLETSYVGAQVESFNQFKVNSAISVPATTQVRFTLSGGSTLVYDYFYGQWGEFTGIPGISSTLFGGMHTFLDSFGRIFQESPGTYLDGSSPVNVSFTTSWLKLTGLQGYQRAYFFSLLGSYASPHTLVVDVAYDYGSPSQRTIIRPDNFSPNWGGDADWGGSTPWGGPPSSEEWQVFFNQQLCESFQISIQEQFDPSLDTIAGVGLTLSALNVVIGARKGYRPYAAKNQGG